MHSSLSLLSLLVFSISPSVLALYIPTNATPISEVATRLAQDTSQQSQASADVNIAEADADKILSDVLIAYTTPVTATFSAPLPTATRITQGDESNASGTVQDMEISPFIEPRGGWHKSSDDADGARRPHSISTK